MNYTKGRVKPIRLVVIHTEESQEIKGSAKRVAQWFAGSSQPDASAHITVDDTNWVQVVADTDTAWGAPGANQDGLHAELAGTASQTPAQWADAYSASMLNILAKKVAQWCKTYNIPAVHLTPAQVADGKTRGICGHIDVTKAFPILAKKYGAHSDPGKDFPWTLFIENVQKELTKLH